MEWFEALLLGLLQGLTEFLPVSSSGHLIIGKELLGIGVQPGAETTFEVVVHTATVMSTIFVFRKDLMALVRGVSKFENNSETHYMLKIFISLIPVMIVGLLFKDQVEMVFGSGILLVGLMLLLTAILLTFTHFFHSGQRSINYRDAFVIGIAQAVAVLPGLSRSGATISTGLLLGNKKEEVARFSFLMVLIPVLGEAFLMLLKGEFSPGASGISTVSLLVGFFAAFLSGVLACKLMIELVKRSKLLFFAIYCFIVALSVIFFTL